MEPSATPQFDKWLSKLRDRVGKALVLRSLEKLAAGTYGDTRGVGGNVSEARIHYGPGYRVYYTQVGDALIVLLVGGDKDSQERDILLAKRMASEL